MCGSFCDNTKWGEKNRCKKNHNKKEAYAINKQTLKVNSRRIILRPVVYQNRFETFCFYSYITYKMVSCWFWNHGWPMRYQLGIILFFWVCLMLGKMLSWLTLTFHPGYLHPGTAFYQWAIISVLGILQWRLLSPSHARTLRMFYCIWLWPWLMFRKQ